MKTNILILKVVLIEIAVIFLLVKLFNSSYFDFIKRARSDAKFHLVKDGKFFVVRDTAENFVPMITF